MLLSGWGDRCLWFRGRVGVDGRAIARDEFARGQNGRGMDRGPKERLACKLAWIGAYHKGHRIKSVLHRKRFRFGQSFARDGCNIGDGTVRDDVDGQVRDVIGGHAIQRLFRRRSAIGKILLTGFDFQESDLFGWDNQFRAQLTGMQSRGRFFQNAQRRR